MNENRAVTEISSALDIIEAPDPLSEEQLQREFDYLISQKMLKSLLDKGMITAEEFDKIMAVNRRKYAPYLADILS